MKEIPVPSQLYRIYWTGRYLERLDMTSRTTLAILSIENPVDVNKGLLKFAENIGVEFKSAKDFIDRILYDENLPASVLHSAKMIRLNLSGLGIERVMRQANMLVLIAEDRVNTSKLDDIIKHLKDLVTAARELGKLIEEELITPPTLPERVLREQLLHQQQ